MSGNIASPKQRTTYILNAFSISAMALSLSSCDTLRNSFGLGHSSPDAFAVATTPPLEVPPEFNLVPPRPGAPNPNEISPTQQAQQKLGAPAQSVDSKDGAKEILEKSEATTKIDPNIRTVVDEEAVPSEGVMEHIDTMLQRAKDNLSGKTSPRPTHSNPAERQ